MITEETGAEFAGRIIIMMMLTNWYCLLLAISVSKTQETPTSL
jgi:hypothetical protein